MLKRSVLSGLALVTLSLGNVEFAAAGFLDQLLEEGKKKALEEGTKKAKEGAEKLVRPESPSQTEPEKASRPRESAPPPSQAGPSASATDAPKPTEMVNQVPDRQLEMIGDDGAPMVLVQAGEFTMGIGSEGSLEPAHRVYLSSYYLDKYEVTVKRYAVFIGSTRHAEPKYWNQANQSSDANRPVIGVNWEDANAYCQHYGKRLPTEAEWEKAARGVDGRNYPWGNEPPTNRHANFGKEWLGYEKTLSIAGEYESGKSPYGVYDLAGNVAEWVADWYEQDYYRKSSKENPGGPLGGGGRVVRGGNWRAKSGAGLESHFRGSGNWGSRTYDVGFRCAKTFGEQLGNK